MIAANRAIQRPGSARLLVVDRFGGISHASRSSLVHWLRPGDLVIANDAATLPASLTGVHARTGAPIEVRLAARASLDPADVIRFAAIMFGAGDFRTRTEDRPAPPSLAPGDRLVLGSLFATVEALLDHPRLVRIRFDGPANAVWARLARHGKPIQYAHMQGPLALWDVWTPFAAVPAAFEPPSAGFALDWATLRAMRDRGVAFHTITLAAGISSTGDPDLDRRLPLDEPYFIPSGTATAIDRQRAHGGRTIAIGTTVVRALEHAAGIGSDRTRHLVQAGSGVANQRLGPESRLRVVSAILTGTHEAGTSHYQLLRAFVDDERLAQASEALDVFGYQTHEFGDSMFMEESRRAARPIAAAA